MELNPSNMFPGNSITPDPSVNQNTTLPQAFPSQNNILEANTNLDVLPLLLSSKQIEVQKQNEMEGLDKGNSLNPQMINSDDNLGNLVKESGFEEITGNSSTHKLINEIKIHTHIEEPFNAKIVPENMHELKENISPPEEFRTESRHYSTKEFTTKLSSIIDYIYSNHISSKNRKDGSILMNYTKSRRRIENENNDIPKTLINDEAQKNSANKEVNNNPIPPISQVEENVIHKNDMQLSNPEERTEKISNMMDNSEKTLNEPLKSLVEDNPINSEINNSLNIKEIPPQNLGINNESFNGGNLGEKQVLEPSIDSNQTNTLMNEIPAIKTDNCLSLDSNNQSIKETGIMIDETSQAINKDKDSPKLVQTILEAHNEIRENESHAENFGNNFLNDILILDSQNGLQGPNTSSEIKLNEQKIDMIGTFSENQPNLTEGRINQDSLNCNNITSNSNLLESPLESPLINFENQNMVLFNNTPQFPNNLTNPIDAQIQMRTSIPKLHNESQQVINFNTEIANPQETIEAHPKNIQGEFQERIISINSTEINQLNNGSNPFPSANNNESNFSSFKTIVEGNDKKNEVINPFQEPENNLPIFQLNNLNLMFENSNTQFEPNFKAKSFQRSQEKMIKNLFLSSNNGIISNQFDPNQRNNPSIMITEPENSEKLNSISSLGTSNYSSAFQSFKNISHQDIKETSELQSHKEINGNNMIHMQQEPTRVCDNNENLIQITPKILQGSIPISSQDISLQQKNEKPNPLESIKEINPASIEESEKAECKDLKDTLTINGCEINDTKPKISIKAFEFGKPIGIGRFGKVVMAREKLSKFIVAIKILPIEAIKSNQLTKNLIKELEIHSSLHHENIINLYAITWDEKNIYMVIEYALFGDLFAHMNRIKDRRIPEKIAQYYMKQIVSAIEYMHSMDIIHRDLKPENIFLSINNTVKIGDFGYSTHTLNEDRKTCCGTIEYFPPEIINRKSHGKAVDIYSIGILLFEMLTGEVPHNGETRKEKLMNILYQDIAFPDCVSPEALEFILLCTNKEPECRPSFDQIKKTKFMEKIFPPNQEIDEQFSDPFYLLQLSNVNN